MHNEVSCVQEHNPGVYNNKCKKYSCPYNIGGRTTNPTGGKSAIRETRAHPVGGHWECSTGREKHLGIRKTYEEGVALVKDEVMIKRGSIWVRKGTGRVGGSQENGVALVWEEGAPGEGGACTEDEARGRGRARRKDPTRGKEGH